MENRNPQRRLWAAAEMSARLLSIPEVPTCMVPLAESYYLLAIELGAQEERVARADAARAAAEAEFAAAVRELPSSTLESVPARISRITTERETLRKRVSDLEQQLATRDKDLRDTKQELERVKQTIRH
jgi:chromosome segregation ATPase